MSNTNQNTGAEGDMALNDNDHPAPPPPLDREQDTTWVITHRLSTDVTSAAQRSGDTPAQRQHRLIGHLASLRSPLQGVELSDHDHAVLTMIADQDASIVHAIASMLARAREAGRQ